MALPFPSASGGARHPPAPPPEPRLRAINHLVQLERYIREIPDFPHAGIGFKDISPLLGDPGALDAAVTGMAELLAGRKVDMVVGAEARGFLLGPALARELGAGFILARKPGKLPHGTVSVEYQL